MWSLKSPWSEGPLTMTTIFALRTSIKRMVLLMLSAIMSLVTANKIMACSLKTSIWEIWRTMILMGVYSPGPMIPSNLPNNKSYFWMILKATRKSEKREENISGRKLKCLASACRGSFTGRASTRRYSTWCSATINSLRGPWSISRSSGCFCTSQSIIRF